MKKLQEERVKILSLWTLFLGISIVIRCLPSMIYPEKILEYLVIFGLCMVSILLYWRDVEIKRIKWCEFFLMATPLFFFLGSGSVKYIFFVGISVVFYFIIQTDCRAISAIKYPVIIFAFITSVVTWISFIAPDFYIEKILSVFPESPSLVYSFLNKNMHHGFTNHFSRNSFYITIAILLLFSNLMNRQKEYRKFTIASLIFFVCTQFLVAKRGLTLFMIATMFLLIFLREKEMKKKVKGSIIFGIGFVILFVAAYFLIPGVDNMVSRILTPNKNGDISSGRFVLYREAWDMFIQHPVFGNGWGSFLSAMEGTNIQGVHNDYLQMLAENGIVGLVVFLAANLGCLYYTYKEFRTIRDAEFDGTQEKQWLYFSFSYQIFFLMYGLTGLPHYSYEQITLYIMMCGYGVGLYKYRNRLKESGE